jgi:hypothetical protein
MERNQVGTDRTDAYIRITISRGVGEIGLDPALCPHPTVVIMTKPLAPPSPELYANGASLIVARTRRNFPGALDPRIKATNFLNNILAKQEAIAAGVFDSLLLNWESHLAECTVSNLFFVSGTRLCTPSLSCGILDSIRKAAHRVWKTGAPDPAVTPTFCRQSITIFGAVTSRDASKPLFLCAHSTSTRHGTCISLTEYSSLLSLGACQ